VRPLDRQHFRTSGADLGAFHRVVVEEDEAVEAEVQPAGERADVLRLGLPVDGRRHHARARQAELGRVSNTRHTSGSSFLLHRHTSTPDSDRRTSVWCSARWPASNSSPRHPPRPPRRPRACCRNPPPRPCGPSRSSGERAAR
jgi:hypothetical protein